TVPAGPGRMAVAEDADAREPPQQPGRVPVGVEEERALVERRPSVAGPNPPRDAGRVGKHGEPARIPGRSRDRLDPEGEKGVAVESQPRAGRGKELLVARREQGADEGGSAEPRCRRDAD